MYLSIFYDITFCLKNNDRILYDLNNFTPYSNNEIDQGCIGLNHCDNDMIQPKNSKLTLLELVFQTAGAINPQPPLLLTPSPNSSKFLPTTPSR